MWKPLRLGIILMIHLSSFIGCKTQTPRNEKDAAEPVAHLQEPRRLEPFHVRTIDRGAEENAADDPEVEVYDAAELFRRASTDYRLEKYDSAQRAFYRLAEEFPTSEFASSSLYNAGLSQEQLGNFADAQDSYNRLIARYPKSKDVTDALFRVMGCMEALEAWDDAVKVADRLLLERSDLTPLERVECLARKGAALLETGEKAPARSTLKEAVYRFKSQKGIPPQASTYYAGMARFKLGEILEKEMHLIALSSDETRLMQELEKKCDLLLDAQTEYSDAIRFGHAHWAAASAYRIGRLYRTLWEDMMNAPVPPDLTLEEREIYLQVLEDRIEVLLKKALRQWGRVIQMAERLNFSNEWVQQTQDEMEEIRTLMRLDNRENRSVTEGVDTKK